MTVNGPKIYFEIPVLGGIRITQTVVSSFVVMVLLCTVGYFLGRKLTKRPGRLQVLTEYLVGLLYGLVEDTMGKHNSHWTPYIGALFLSSICGSLIGMTGIFRSATSDISTTLTWAIMTSVLVWSNTIKRNGIASFLKGYLNPLNIVSDVAQPISMAFRHFGNILGGGVLMSLLYSALSVGSSAILRLISSNGILISLVVLVLGILLFLRGFKKGKLIGKIAGIAFCLIGLSGILMALGVVNDIPILALGLPGLLSLYFDVFSGLVQALVFSLLTMVYVGIACPPPEESKKG